jgi:hypothetical protein
MSSYKPIKDKVGHITHYKKTMSSGEMRITDKPQRRVWVTSRTVSPMTIATTFWLASRVWI